MKGSKSEVLKILNEELNRADLMIEQATKAQNLVGKFAWQNYKELVKSLIKRLQDET